MYVTYGLNSSFVCICQVFICQVFICINLSSAWMFAICGWFTENIFIVTAPVPVD